MFDLLDSLVEIHDSLWEEAQHDAYDDKHNRQAHQYTDHGGIHRARPTGVWRVVNTYNHS